MSLEITWRGPKTETSQHPSHPQRARRNRGRQRQRRSKERVRGVKKVQSPGHLWPVKITWWAFRVSEGEGGRGIRSLSALQGTDHAWLTLWIRTEPIYMLFLLPLHPILKVCQSQSLCLFQISLTSMCVHVTVHVFGRGKPPGIFLMHRLLHMILKPHSRVSLVSTVFLSNVFCAACSSRGLIMLGLKAQTTRCQRQTINHTQSLVGEYALFYSFEGLAIQHKVMTNKSNKLFIVLRVEMVTSLHADRNGICANELAVNAFYLKPGI